MVPIDENTNPNNADMNPLSTTQPLPEESVHEKHTCPQLTTVPIDENTNPNNVDMNPLSTTQPLPEESPKQPAMIDGENCPNMNPLTTPLPESLKVSDNKSRTPFNELNANMNPLPTTTPLPESPQVSNNEPITNVTITAYQHSPKASDTSLPPKHLKQMKERRKKKSVSNADMEQPENLKQLKPRKKRKSVSNAEMKEPPTKRAKVRRSKRIQCRKQANKGPQVAEECLVDKNICTDVVVVAIENNNEVEESLPIRENID